MMGVVIFTGLALSSAWAQAPQKTEVYFAQGQAMYYPNDRPRSQMEAIEDLASSGVLQAVAAVLGPAGTQSMFGVIQEKILSNKGKYIDGYQLASEGLANGLYRVTGQVTISRELLLHDLREHGFQVPPSAQPGLVEGVQDKAAGAVPNRPQAVWEGRSVHDAGGSKPMVGWVVAENWDTGWVLPEHEVEGGLPPFARSVLERARNLDWTPRFLPAQSLQPDKQGNLQGEEVLALARRAGWDKMVMGKSWLDPSPPGSRRLRASLQIVDLPTETSEGEISEEYALEAKPVAEGVLHLAESVLPAIDHALARSEESGVGEAIPEAGLPPESWTVTIRASHPQSAWEMVRKEIEAMFKDAKTSGFEMGVDHITARIDGMDGRAMRDSLDGREISPGGPKVQVLDFLEEQRSMTVVFGGIGENQ
jgi:nucleotide-binding universal stress UspA family protein